MKINKVITFLIIFFLNPSISLSDDIKFQSEKIDIKKNGDEVFAFKSKTLIPEDDITITSDKVRYLKKENILIFTENVIFNDKLNDITIISDKINYDRKINLINSEGPTKFNLTNYKIKSSNVFFDRNKQIIYGDEDTILKDKDGNIIKLKNKFNLNVEKEVAQASNSIILDKDGNKYIFEDLAINLKTNEIAGKEIKIDFKNTYFGNEENDPLLKGKSSYSNENELKVYKAVFSTCNTINKNCRGWELNAEEFKHDKERKVFEYKNSWLKIFDFKVFYLPYFNHPDPSVKRKSGFLTPSYGSSDSLGTQINFPYFKVLSEDKDMTFNPRYYADKSFLLQNEYRQALRNSNIISDFSFLVGDAGSKGHFFYNQIGKIDKNLSYKLNLQNVKGDNFLKTHKLKNSSPIITNDSVLVSNVDLNWIFDDSDLNTSFIIYEDLSRSNNDRYQYIFPDFNYLKKIKIPDNYNGNFNFNSYGYNKLYDTNITETVLTNDFIFSSNEFINSKGIATDYDLLLKNANNYSQNSSKFNENANYNLFGILKIDTSYPLQKKLENYTNFLKPIVSLRYSPNGNTDLSSKDVFLNYSSVFSLNRIGESSQVEGGESLTLGLEFKRTDNFGLDILDFKFANVIKNNENYKMPSMSKLNKKRSDIFGNFNFRPSNNLKLEYNFSYDKDLKYSNRDQLGIDFSVNNFLTNISYYSVHNDLPEQESIKNTNTFKLDNENIFMFEISKDLKDNFTQYYDLTYKYETDCLSLNLNFNKSFFRDGSLEPNQSISFLLKIIPFTELGVKNLEGLINK